MTLEQNKSPFLNRNSFSCENGYCATIESIFHHNKRLNNVNHKSFQWGRGYCEKENTQLSNVSIELSSLLYKHTVKPCSIFSIMLSKISFSA